MVEMKRNGDETGEKRRLKTMTAEERKEIAVKAVKNAGQQENDGSRTIPMAERF